MICELEPVNTRLPTLSNMTPVKSIVPFDKVISLAATIIFCGNLVSSDGKVVLPVNVSVVTPEKSLAL